MSIGRDDVLHVAKLAELAVKDEDLTGWSTRSTASWTTWPSSTGAGRRRGRAVPAGPGAASRCARMCPGPVPLARPPAAIAPEFADGFFLVPRHGAMEDR